MQIAHAYLAGEHVIAQEQKQQLPEAQPTSRIQEATQATAATQTKVAPQPRHRGTFTRAQQPSRKIAKAARRSAKAGRKASR